MSHSPPRIALLGHGPVGRRAGEAILALGWDLVFVHAHAPSRGDWQPGLAPWAAAHAIPCRVDLPPGSEWGKVLSSVAPDLLVSAYCRSVLPPDVLRLATWGGVNLHGSLLPDYRGRAPVNWMVLAGEEVGGVTLHQMTRRVDRGPILGQQSFPIGPQETAFDLLMKVAQGGGELLREVLPGFLRGDVSGVAQGVGTTFGRRTPEDGRLDCQRPARELYDLIRAVTRPYPGAFVEWQGKRLTIWWAQWAPMRLPPGQLAMRDGGLYLGTADGALHVLDWTLEGEAAGKDVQRLTESFCRYGASGQS